MHEALVYKVDEAINRHDVGGLVENYAPYAVMTGGYLREPIRGRESLSHQWAAIFRAFPDLCSKVQRTFESGDSILVEYAWTGTNTGPLEAPWGIIPPTGKKVSMEGVCLLRLNPEGFIVEDKGFFDSLSLIGQLGLLSQVSELAKVTPMVRAA
ncbi:MAG: ester cyclase [Chloroflexi bacterium]|nr:ester cyclase [Chloroflexota bacterium]